MRLDFKGDRVIEPTEAGRTLLEYSLESGIPHVHECYGSARCSTCRVRIISGLENLSDRNEAEARIGKMKGWPDHIRLACQARPSGDVVLKRLVLDEEDIRLAWSEVSRLRSGVEKEIAVLFLDVEKFTGFTERNLPYDVIHVMNKLFNRLGDVVLANNGYIDKFIGDSIMALFGIEGDDIAKSCLDAVVSAAAIQREVESFNIYLDENFHHRFGVRIGISAGSVILGNLGHRDRAQYTAIGDVVNTASRLESANKRTATRVLIAERVFELTQNSITRGKRFRLKLRGQSEPQTAYELLDVADSLKQGSLAPAVARETATEASDAGASGTAAQLPSDMPAWETDNDHTEIGFEIGYLTTSVRGIFRVHLVEIRYEEDHPERTALSAMVKTASIDTFVAARDNHLRSADFFDSEHHPNMTFQSQRVEVKSADEFVLMGQLTIRGTTKEVALAVKAYPPLADAWGVYKRGFTAEATIDRYDFGIPFNLPLSAGSFAIGRDVHIRLTVQMSRAAASAG